MEMTNLDEMDPTDIAALFVLVVEQIGEIGQPVVDELGPLLEGAPESKEFDTGLNLIGAWVTRHLASASR